jgi:hypothetical protein
VGRDHSNDGSHALPTRVQHLDPSIHNGISAWCIVIMGRLCSQRDITTEYVVPLGDEYHRETQHIPHVQYNRTLSVDKLLDLPRALDHEMQLPLEVERRVSEVGMVSLREDRSSPSGERTKDSKTYP